MNKIICSKSPIKFGEHPLRRIIISGILGFLLLTSGCKTTATFKVINNYSFPVDVYDASHSPSYSPELLGSVAQNATTSFMIYEMNDGNFYHFVVRKHKANVVKDIRLPSADLNASLNNASWQLVLGSDHKAPSNKGSVPLKKAKM